MKIRLSLVFVFTLFYCVVSAQITIRGNAPDYAGFQFRIYTNADPVSSKQVELCTFEVAKDGSFQTTINSKKTLRAFADFNGYSSSIYLVPGKSYEIMLPPFEKITESQKRNPFFRPETIHLATRNAPKDELNRKIREFEQAFQQKESLYFNKIYDNRSSEAADSLKADLNRLFPKTNDPIFEDYRFYKFGFIDFALHQGQDKNFISTYFTKHKPNYSVAPCMELFNRLFSDYFSQLANTIDGSEFKMVLGKGDPNAITDYFISKKGFSTELAQMVVLRSIKDAFFQGQFSQKGLLTLLDKIETGNWDTDKKAIATRLKSELTYMLPGTSAPVLTMKDFSNKIFDLNNFKGKLIYLHFTRVENPLCRQHLDELKKLPEAVLNKVKIINLVLTDELPKKDLILKQNWPGNFMLVTDELANQWQINTFPTSFLIDENGKLIYSPALNPLDGFARQIGTFLQKRHIDKLRNQAK